MRRQIIDHAYFHDHTNKMKIQIDRYSYYHSDHDAFCIIIKPYTAVTEPNEDSNMIKKGKKLII